MLIKKRSNNYNKLLLIFFSKISKRKRLLTFLIIFFILFLYPLLILEIDKIHPTYQKSKIVLQNNLMIINNYIKSFNQKTETIYLDIQDLDFKKLEYIKKLSNKYYLGLDNLDEVSLKRKEWVPALLRYENQEYNIDIRVKGQSYDHWGKYGSYKIKMKNDDTLFGMKRFAVQHPKTRGFMNEWYYHKFLLFNDLISLRYKFIRLNLNGEQFPIFALEENFDKRLLENNQKKEGLIFRINLNLEYPVQFQHSEREIQENEFFIEQSKIIKKNIELFFDNKLLPSDIFDIPSLAKFYAIKDLWGNRHAGQLKNMRFYYNQLTSLIEPVGYDQQTVYPTQLLGLIGSKKFINKNNLEKNYFNILFSDEIFYSEYIKSLEQISSKSLLDDFFEIVDIEASDQIKILYKSYPYFQLKSKYQPLLWPYQDIDELSYRDSLWLPGDKNILYKNQNYIRSLLNLEDNSLFIKEVLKTNDNNLLISFVSNENLDIQLRELFINNIKIDHNNKFIIRNNSTNELIVEITKKNNFENISDVKFNYSFIGSDKIQSRQVNYLLQKYYIDEFKKYDLESLSNLAFLQIDNKKNLITINKGQHIIDQPLIIPPGFYLEIFPGAKILISKSGKLISYSPVNFLGNENDNIHIYSDVNSQGLSVINANGVSNINYVKFSDLGNINHAGIINTGSINFYNSDINIKNSIIENADAEDAINIIHSKFLIDNLKIINSKSDAIDLDFSNGIIKNSFFINNGNDGIDISAGNVKLENVNINKSGDKGISIGEKSSVYLNFAKINNSFIGLAVKDQSKLSVDNENIQSLNEGLMIKNSEYGIALYQKKSEFGPSEVHIGDTGNHYLNLEFENVNDQFVVEENSYLRIGPLNITDYNKNVYEFLYPK